MIDEATVRTSAAEQAVAFERFKRHVDLPRMADELRALRDEVVLLTTAHVEREAEIARLRSLRWPWQRR